MVHELIGITNGRVRIEHEEMLELRVGLCCFVAPDVAMRDPSPYHRQLDPIIQRADVPITGHRPLRLVRPLLLPKPLCQLW